MSCMRRPSPRRLYSSKSMSKIRTATPRIFCPRRKPTSKKAAATTLRAALTKQSALVVPRPPAAWICCNFLISTRSRHSTSKSTNSRRMSAVSTPTSASWGSRAHSRSNSKGGGGRLAAPQTSQVSTGARRAWCPAKTIARPRPAPSFPQAKATLTSLWKLVLVRRIVARWAKIIRSPLSSSRIFCAAVAIAGFFCIPAKPKIAQKCLSRQSEKQTPTPRRRSNDGSPPGRRHDEPPERRRFPLRPLPRLVCKFDPDRRMVACFLPASHVAIDAGRLKARGDGRAQEQVVEAQSRVTRVGVSEIVPEGVDALSRMKRSQRVGPALRDQPAEGFTHLDA